MIDSSVFMPGVLFKMKTQSISEAFWGRVVYYYGLFLIVEVEEPYYNYLNPGFIIVSELSLGEQNCTFSCDVNFKSNRNNQLCLNLPPDLRVPERRKYLRIPAELPVRYSLGDKTVMSRTINVSAGGIYFFTPERVYTGQILNLTLYLPDKELSLRAIVKRTMQNAATVEFADKNNCNQELLEFIFYSLA